MDVEIDHQALLETFQVEARGDLEALEEALLALENDDPRQPEALGFAFRSAHNLKGNAGILGLSRLEEIAHVLEEVFEGLRQGAVVVDYDLVTLLLRSVDALRDALVNSGAESVEHRALLEALLSYANAPHPSPRRATRTDRDAVAGEPSLVRRDGRGGGVPARSGENGSASWGRSGEHRSLRVDLAKLDEMVDLVGQLSVARGHEAQLVDGGNDRENLLEAQRETGRLFLDLQELVMRARMVRLGPTFRAHHRTVRDMARSLGKEARLTISGEEVEADTAILEHLRDPLTHMIRNALYHGIELPEERRRRGKSACGRLVLSARHEGGSIVIELADDGAGLDRARILARARALGLVPAGQDPAPQDVDRLIFEAGLSTAERANEISGRGVGMDVVRRAIEALRGTVRIASRDGEGTTLTLRLPLTLAIIEGLVVGLGGDRYVIPMDAVVESVELPAAGAEGRGVLRHRGRSLPYVHLRRFFHLDAPPPRRQVVVVVDLGERRSGLVVDAIYGQHQTVIKPLAKLLQGVAGLSGTTILGDGGVAFILDVTALVDGETERAGRRRLAEVPRPLEELNRSKKGVSK